VLFLDLISIIFYTAAMMGAFGGVLVARQNVKGFYFLVTANLVFAVLPNPPRDALTVFMLVYALLGSYSIYSWKRLERRLANA
jgi:nicotinamide riboside transporter PnuC